MPSIFTAGNHSINSAVREHGKAVEPLIIQQSVYTGQSLPAILLEAGGDPQDYQQLLRLSRIGNVFSELVEGTPIVIPKKSSFSKHPET